MDEKWSSQTLIKKKTDAIDENLQRIKNQEN